MTYLSFILIFVLPPTLIALVLAFIRFDQLPKGAIGSAVALIVLALVYTIPWDRHLILTGVWGYPEDRVLGTFLAIPVEELSFIILQAFGVSAWTLYLTRILPIDTQIPSAYSERLAFERARWFGIGAALQIFLFGILFLQIDATRYLGLLLSWVGPVLLLQCSVGGALLWKLRQIWLLSILPPFLYLCLVDRIAIGFGIWYFSPEYTSGIRLLGLPLEEALFFFLTCTMVSQGVLLYTGLLRNWSDQPETAPRWIRSLILRRSNP
ncbi:MAG: lycopene cyclase domain-containing protein [Puniceicoccaceae bacterium]